MVSQSNVSGQITVADMAPHVHSFLPGENKVNKISAWLVSWIEESLKTGKIKPYDMLPPKGDLAFHIGVSKGTIQNVFRSVEDLGLIESKQRIGTYISDRLDNSELKLTSKRDIAIEIIKKYIKENDYQIGDCLVATRKLANAINISNTTVRIALGSLISQGIIKKENNSFVIENLSFNIEDKSSKTLVEKTAERLRLYIEYNLTPGERLPSNKELTSKFGVSTKTVHDALKCLAKEGILYVRRGQYGTVVADDKENHKYYDYQRVEQKILAMISKSGRIGEKLPSILELAKEYQVSAKTVKKALDNLSEEGFIRIIRGRFGGTYVINLPEEDNEAYKWLALSREYVPNIEN